LESKLFEISEMLITRAMVAHALPQGFVQNFGILPTSNSPSVSAQFIIITFICLFKT
jgi:hypothetical protein